MIWRRSIWATSNYPTPLYSLYSYSFLILSLFPSLGCNFSHPFRYSIIWYACLISCFPSILLVIVVVCGGGGVNVTVNVKIWIPSLINPHSVKTCRVAELWLHAFFISAVNHEYGGLFSCREKHSHRPWINCTETSVSIYRSTLRNIPEERKSYWAAWVKFCSNLIGETEDKRPF